VRWLVVILLAGCAAKTPPPRPPPPPQCGGRPLTVHFYDVAQALAVLVDLPDGRRILVDAGDKPDRTGCGDRCEVAQQHLIDSLLRDLGGQPIAMLWVTHQHSDHLGGVIEVARTFKVGTYVDNGTDLTEGHPLNLAVRAAVQGAGASVVVVDGAQRAVPMAGDAEVRLSSVVRTPWTGHCGHQNNCSIGLRIDYCASSILFVGDAESGAEAQLDSGGAVTLLQVGHHGSNTSSSEAFLSRVAPRYAVISAGKPYEGTNRTYCLPTEPTVSRLTKHLGGPTPGRTIRAFGGKRCPDQTDADWHEVPASARLWSTSVDGDIVLRTSGDGTFTRIVPSVGSSSAPLRMLAR
jgi:beta-lactamase superfamily II metal-dependent hydrolase